MDVLGSPMSTASSEQAFSTSGQVLDSFRSSLDPKSVQALICAQSWLRLKPIYIINALDELRSLKKCMKVHIFFPIFSFCIFDYD